MVRKTSAQFESKPEVSLGHSWPQLFSVERLTSFADTEPLAHFRLNLFVPLDTEPLV